MLQQWTVQSEAFLIACRFQLYQPLRKAKKNEVTYSTASQLKQG
jgi:hypothetical protein